jgi:hypothetical protein
MQPRFLSIAAGLAAALGLLLEAGAAWPHDRAPAAWHWLFLAAAAAALLQLGLRRDGSAAARLRRLAWLVPVGLGLLLLLSCARHRRKRGSPEGMHACSVASKCCVPAFSDSKRAPERWVTPP